MFFIFLFVANQTISAWTQIWACVNSWDTKASLDLLQTVPQSCGPQLLSKQVRTVFADICSD